VAILKAEEESPTLTVLEIEVPAEESEEARRGVTRAYAKQAALPGFRKGHAPESVVQKLHRADPGTCSARHPRAVSAIEERKLSVLGRPRIEALTWDPPGPIRFTARLEKKPPIEPGEYRGIPVEDASVEPSEQEVSQVLDRLREGHAEFHPIEGRPAAPGDYAVAESRALSSRSWRPARTRARFGTRS
jgi:trigger factor